MARKEKTVPVQQDVDLDHSVMNADMEKVNSQALANSLARENASALAQEFGYEGNLTVGALEDEIRFFQRRTAEACLELGKRLLLLKELTAHGEFEQRIELLGFAPRAAQKFMQAAFKFSKSANLALLAEKVGTQSKLLELVTLDDEELESLADGKSVRGLELDDIDTLTYSELKAKLREARSNEEAQGRILSDKNTKIDTLTTQLLAKEKRTVELSPDEIAKELRTEGNLHAFEAEHVITGKLYQTFKALAEHSQDNGGNHREYMTGLVVQVELALAQLREDFGIDKTSADSDSTPLWMRPDADSILSRASNFNAPKTGSEAAAG
jgi:hypothetical protein